MRLIDASIYIKSKAMITQVREFYKIEFLEDVPCLYWQMRGDIGSEDFKQAVMLTMRTYLLLSIYRCLRQLKKSILIG